MSRSRALPLLVAAVATVPACSDDPAPAVPNAILADLAYDLHIVIGTGGDGVERLYVRARGIPAGCPVLDETFGISVDGVAIPDVFPGGPDDWECAAPGGAVELADGVRPGVIRMYDASKEIVARLDARLVEPRRLTLTSHPSWAIAGGERVTVTVSHPEDFDRPVLEAYIAAGSPVVSLGLELAVNGDQVAFTMPAGIDDFDDGEVRIRFPTIDLAAASCDGAARCRFDWSPATYAHGFER